MGSIHDRALAAQAREEFAQLAQETEQKTRDFLIGLLGSLPDDHHVSSNGSIDVEGIIFSRNRIKGRCPKCNAWTASAQLFTLADLHEALTQFQPGPGHEHEYAIEARPAAQAPTLGALIDRLVERIEKIESDLYS